MEPMLVVDRRTVLLEQLGDLARRGIEWEEARKREKHKLDEITTTDKQMRRNNYWWQYIGYLKKTVLNETLALLESYETETLEHLARAFNVQINAESDCLHWCRSYNGTEWNSVAGENRNAMFRDMLYLRRYASGKAESMVHTLMDLYRALDLQPGSIYSMPVEEFNIEVAPVFRGTFSSHSVIWLRHGTGGQGARTDRHGNFVPPNEMKVHEDYRRAHLVPEAIEYLRWHPERFQHLREYMMAKRETLYEIDFEFLAIEQEAHKALRDGAL